MSIDFLACVASISIGFWLDLTVIARLSDLRSKFLFHPHNLRNCVTLRKSFYKIKLICNIKQVLS